MAFTLVSLPEAVDGEQLLRGIGRGQLQARVENRPRFPKRTGPSCPTEDTATWGSFGNVENDAR